MTHEIFRITKSYNGNLWSLYKSKLYSLLCLQNANTFWHCNTGKSLVFSAVIRIISNETLEATQTTAIINIWVNHIIIGIVYIVYILYSIIFIYRIRTVNNMRLQQLLNVAITFPRN